MITLVTSAVLIVMIILVTCGANNNHTPGLSMQTLVVYEQGMLKARPSDTLGKSCLSIVDSINVIPLPPTSGRLETNKS